MNKKIIVIVVIVECVLAILLISILGKAIENYFSEIMCDEVYFVNEEGVRYAEGDTITVEITASNMGYQLHYELNPTKTSNKAVTFTSNNDFVLVDENGYVTFLKLNATAVITVETMSGHKTAEITLMTKKQTGGDVDLD